MNSFELKIALRYLGSQRKNILVSLISLFSLAGVAIGSFALIVVLSGMNGFEEEVTQQMMGKDAHFELMRYHEEPIKEYQKITEQVKKDEDVVAAAPFIISKVGISSKKMNDGIVIYGIDPEQSKDVSLLDDQIIYGEYFLDSLQGDRDKKFPTIIIGNVLANRLRVVLGDKLVLQTFASPADMSLGSIGPKMVQVMISGIYESGMYEYDGNLAYVSIPTAQKLLDMDGATGVQAMVKDPWNAEVVAERIKNSFGYPYYTMDWKARNRTMLKWMKLEKLIFGIGLCLIILVAAFNIISSLIMMVLEKTREIGILRAMGCSRGSILRIFMMAGSLIGLVGTVLGIGAGLALIALHLKFGLIKLPPEVYNISLLPVKVLWTDVLAVFLTSSFISLVVTLPPAWKASKLDPVGAIRHE